MSDNGLQTDYKFKADNYAATRARNLGDNLRLALARRGWTTERLRKSSGVSASQISQIRNAKANPTLDTIARLEYALHEKLI